MAAPIGNSFWKQRSSHGRKPTFATPEDLWGAACEYFEWVEDNPLTETKLFSYEGEIVEGEIPKMRAMTIQGLCFFLDISDETWATYSKNKDFIGICENIKKVIFTQKFEGASAGFLNASIISRELGLAETTKTDITTNGESLKQQASDLTDEQLAAIVAKIDKSS